MNAAAMFVCGMMYSSRSVSKRIALSAQDPPDLRVRARHACILRHLQQASGPSACDIGVRYHCTNAPYILRPVRSHSSLLLCSCVARDPVLSIGQHTRSAWRNSAMKRFHKLLGLLLLFTAVWLFLCVKLAPAEPVISILVYSLPILLLGLFGLYALALLIHGVLTFRTVPSEAASLRVEVEQAVHFLRKQGIDWEKAPL